MQPSPPRTQPRNYPVIVTLFLFCVNLLAIVACPEGEVLIHLHFDIGMAYGTQNGVFGNWISIQNLTLSYNISAKLKDMQLKLLRSSPISKVLVEIIVLGNCQRMVGCLRELPRRKNWCIPISPIKVSTTSMTSVVMSFYS